MTSEETRQNIVRVALEWQRTPYRNTGCIKGVAANCAMLLYGVAKEAGALPADAPHPRWYSSQYHVHRKDERLIEYVKSYGAVEIPESKIGPGDIVLYRSAMSHGHAAIVIRWPEIIIHTLPNVGCVKAHGMNEGILRAKQRMYFSLIRLEGS